MTDQEKSLLDKLREKWQALKELLEALSSDNKDPISDADRMKQVKEIFTVTTDDIDNAVNTVVTDLTNTGSPTSSEVLNTMLRDWRDVSYIVIGRQQLLYNDRKAAVDNSKYTVSK